MLGLALDSAGLIATAALWAGDAVTAGGDEETVPNRSSSAKARPSFQLLAHHTLPPETGKADQLITVVEALLGETGRRYQDLDVIAVNRGPGSFTGIRSAVALGRGLALATGCPVIGVTSHETIAASIGANASAVQGEPPRRLMVAEDARRGQVYRQAFDQELSPLGGIVAEAPEEAASALAAGRWLLAGSGADLVEEALSGAEVMVKDHILDAGIVALAAERRLARGDQSIAGFDLAPLYIRPPDAIRPKPLISPSSPTAGREA